METQTTAIEQPKQITERRKIIQYMFHDKTYTIFALCDDGTLWNFDISKNSWDKIPEIPQD